MQEKKLTFRDTLIAEKKKNQHQNNFRSLFQGMIVLSAMIFGEFNDTPYSRIIGTILFIIVVRLYNKISYEAGMLLRYHDEKVKFRKAARDNKVEEMKGFIAKFGKERVNTYGKDSGRNALHFAVRAGAKDALELE